jgi:hypothetical protein
METKRPQHPKPYLPSEDAFPGKVHGRFGFLVAEAACIIILKAMTFATRRRPQALMQQEPEEKFAFGRSSCLPKLRGST